MTNPRRGYRSAVHIPCPRSICHCMYHLLRRDKMHQLIIAALLLTAAPLTVAQVYKCKDATGKHIFSDRPCDAVGGQGKQMLRERTFDEVQSERIQAYEATVKKYERREREALAEMEDERRARIEQRQREAMTRSAPRTQSYEERMAERNASVTGNLTPYHARQRSTHRTDNDTPSANIPPQPTPSMVTNCNGRACYDDAGGNYTKSGNNPNVMFGSDGKTCFRNGNFWNCN